MKAETRGRRREDGPDDPEMETQAGQRHKGGKRPVNSEAADPGVRGTRRETGRPDCGAAAGAGLPQTLGVTGGSGAV